jgi:hypothetical protein
MQFIITKTISNLTYWWDGTKFTSYALHQITFATKEEAQAEAVKHHMSLITIRELD